MHCLAELGWHASFLRTVDCQKANYSGNAGMSAPASRENAYPGPARAEKPYKTALDIRENSRCASSGEFLTFDSPRSWGSAELPWDKLWLNFGKNYPLLAQMISVLRNCVSSKT